MRTSSPPSLTTTGNATHTRSGRGCPATSRFSTPHPTSSTTTVTSPSATRSPTVPVRTAASSPVPQPGVATASTTPRQSAARTSTASARLAERRQHPDPVHEAREVAEHRQQDVEPEVLAPDADGEEHAERRDDDREDDAENLHVGGLPAARGRKPELLGDEPLEAVVAPQRGEILVGAGRGGGARLAAEGPLRGGGTRSGRTRREIFRWEASPRRGAGTRGSSATSRSKRSSPRSEVRSSSARAAAR